MQYHGERPTVANQMVGGEHELMLLIAKLQQLRTEYSTGSQVKRRRHVAGQNRPDLLTPLFGRKAGKVPDRHFNFDTFHEFLILPGGTEAAPESVVPVDNLLHGLKKFANLQHPVETN